MPADFSEPHVERQDVLGGKTSLNYASGPSFRDFVQHAVDRFVARGRGEPDLDLALIGRHTD
ncbi:hypothetical protein [Bradyrhizobium sp. BRP56]|uniref:hypothetical protein n=1 Tax=Bradyrhizobium sp. BRP56 TaxID=2793819 RepID=UPI001CD4CFB9|nr:hypothetical protein [Bradyrhizobium sp. BRP56]MCA1396400.1 hypothetical protein [Bradyrhizobium sp. BRP56]